MVAYRSELNDRIEKGLEHPRRVRFAECDYSKKENADLYLVEKEKILYPNIIIFLWGKPIPLNLFEQSLSTPEEEVNYLKDRFLKETNFYVPEITCEQFKANVENNVPMTVYWGPVEYTYQKGPMDSLVKLHSFDKLSFNNSVVNLFILDYN